MVLDHVGENEPTVMICGPVDSEINYIALLDPLLFLT